MFRNEFACFLGKTKFFAMKLRVFVGKPHFGAMNALAYFKKKISAMNLLVFLSKTICFAMNLLGFLKTIFRAMNLLVCGENHILHNEFDGPYFCDCWCVGKPHFRNEFVCFLGKQYCCNEVAVFGKPFCYNDFVIFWWEKHDICNGEFA